MTTDNVRLLDELEVEKSLEVVDKMKGKNPSTDGDEEDVLAPTPAHPQAAPTLRTSSPSTLRHSSAMELAERCSERLGLIQAVCESAKFARKVDRNTRRLLYIDQLSQFVVSSQAIPIAVGLVFGRTLSNNVDSFVKAFVSPLLAALGGKTHLDSMNFTINGAVFAYGAFLQSVIQTAFTVVALFYLVVIPMSTFTSLKYVHHVLCPEVVDGGDENNQNGGGGGGGGRGGSGHADGDEDAAAEDPTERRGASKSRGLRGLGKLWSSATR